MDVVCNRPVGTSPLHDEVRRRAHDSGTAADQVLAPYRFRGPLAWSSFVGIWLDHSDEDPHGESRLVGLGTRLVSVVRADMFSSF